MANRRSFLKKSALASLSTLVGAEIVFANNLPEGLSPVILQDNTDFYSLFDKHKDMIVLNDRPWNAEAQAHLLDDEVTPASKMFVRNNGLIPNKIDVNKWTLTIEGESAKQTKTYTLSDLKKFPKHTYNLTLECGGNGRSEFNPPAKGNQWTVGAVSCASWTGVRLKDLLMDVGLKSDAVYIGYYGTDTHLSGNPEKEPISRGIPLAKALQEETLVAYSMNGQDIPIAHGHPLRLVAGGWPASVSGKWVNRLVIRNKVHDGAKMGGQSYRVPCEAVEPGTNVPDEKMCIIESMPVKSLITYPKTGALLNKKSLDIRGHAWAGELQVKEVHYSIDFGATWHLCELQAPVNRLAWQRWSAKASFPINGYYEVWVRATDENGHMQPMVIPGWNPKGYLNNACHRIAVKVS
ncbi:molybdopterin containing oxidoreductase [Fulvivirga sp. RKSG066]|uniref:sulfite oxidase n=1 Tax=Fulvivirga aurantia TaxID=2529383 RepID=UPI0012BCDDB2|nr:sulfite oxidase [Fulvivirga aurantia]MTI21503.1 molybdopterin containing oxidoreductase [Fulvivirga aurantia]